MRKITKNQLIPLSLGVLIFSFLIVIYIFAWTEPSQAPPGANVSAPTQFSPGTYQVDDISSPFSPSIWIKNTAGDDFLRLQDAADDVKVVIGYNGNVGIGTDTPGTKLEVQGEVKSIVGGTEFYMVPKGTIVMWSGTLASIPAGWQLCDGTNGTPNLVDRFILGVLPGEDPGATGGGPTHSHTVDIWASLRGGGVKLNCQNCGDVEVIKNHPSDSGEGTSWEDWEGTDDDNAGIRKGTTNVNHLPPYYKLAFIMKL